MGRAVLRVSGEKVTMEALVQRLQLETVDVKVLGYIIVELIIIRIQEKLLVKSKMNTPGASISEIDKQIFELHNNMRKDAKMLIPDLEDMIKKFDGLLLKRPGKVTLRTKEGVNAVNEAIEFLRK